ncbi:nuclear transport factor 2 family protein [Chryseobacterium cheonjiense]|uniref:Nuclear transport factor 2 family protein n=1 Tax=Chryseobacterium cheonjiense TaxID=2728845 RepID=A0A7Y0A431_9FLAO|nr:nuclear transport factor 2 family protein [Chryseobacterium cheonjiense]NML56269.1 nuclear transport factor 2 family protein [Chryseobacterium cheonjiense]
MDHKSILLEANKAITEGDHEKFLSYCTADTRWIFVGDQTLKGIDEVRKYISEAYQTPPKFKVDLMIEEGDYLTAMGTISLLNENSEWQDFEYCDVWKFENGKMAELKAFVV